MGGFGQRRLKEARIAVVGAGGIGSAVIPALAGAGVGKLTIIDSDTVDVANLHRQPLYRERDAGYSKAELALQSLSSNTPTKWSRPGGSGGKKKKKKMSGSDSSKNSSDSPPPFCSPPRQPNPTQVPACNDGEEAAP